MEVSALDHADRGKPAGRSMEVHGAGEIVRFYYVPGGEKCHTSCIFHVVCLRKCFVAI